MGKLESAIHLAVRAHAGQADPDKMPHIVHSLEVMSMVRNEVERKPVPKFSTKDMMVAAVLHDVVEDTRVTLDEVRKFYGKRIADTVDAVTRRKTSEGKEPYRDFIYRAKAHPAARVIKEADLLHNMARNPRMQGTKKAAWAAGLVYKYEIAHRVLNTALSWEQSSTEHHLEEGGEKYYVADPNGKRIEVTKKEIEAIYAGKR